MKKIISLLYIIFSLSLAYGQGDKALHIIYVDNYQSALDAGLSDAMVESLHGLIGTVSGSHNSVYMYMTDNDNSSETSNPETLESMYKQINNHTHIGTPVNELKDIRDLREGILEQVAKHSPQDITFSFFVSSDVMDMAINSTSVLIDFFPKEVAAAAPGATVNVNVYHSRNTAARDKIEKSFGFYNTAEYKSKLNFRVVEL